MRTMGKAIAGIIQAMDREEKIDPAAFRKIINYLIESGVHGLLSEAAAGR